MSYELVLERRARKDLVRLPKDVYERVDAALSALRQDPHPPNSLKLSGREGYRLQIGRDYRALYRIDDDRREVTVTRVGHRQGVYR